MLRKLFTTFQRTLLIAMAMGSMTGCTMEAGIWNLSPIALPRFQKAGSLDNIVPAGQQGFKTSAGYWVSSSVSYMRYPIGTATNGNYHVTHGSQGTLSNKVIQR